MQRVLGLRKTSEAAGEENDSRKSVNLMENIPGGPHDLLTVRHDALSLAFAALCRRLLASGAMHPDDLPKMRAAAMQFPARLQQAASSKMQIAGGRLANAVVELFAHLDGSDYAPLDHAQVWQTARLLLTQHKSTDAVTLVWRNIQELTARRDRLGVETWCDILDAVEEIISPMPEEHE